MRSDACALVHRQLPKPFELHQPVSCPLERTQTEETARPGAAKGPGEGPEGSQQVSSEL